MQYFGFDHIQLAMKALNAGRRKLPLAWGPTVKCWSSVFTNTIQSPRSTAGLNIWRA